MRKILRRDFIKSAAVAAGGIALSEKLLAKKKIGGNTGTDDPSTVIVVTDDQLTHGMTIDETVLQIIVDTGIITYTGLPDVGEAWMSLSRG